MKTSPFAIGLVIFCTLLTSTAQYLWKNAMALPFGSISQVLSNYWLWAGFITYAISACLLIIALKYGELSVVYPFISTSFVWVTFISMSVFNEHIAFTKWAGVVAIIIGISFIGVGSR